jgi:hypothetical protein
MLCFPKTAAGFWGNWNRAELRREMHGTGLGIGAGVFCGHASG